VARDAGIIAPAQRVCARRWSFFFRAWAAGTQAQGHSPGNLDWPFSGWQKFKSATKAPQAEPAPQPIMKPGAELLHYLDITGSAGGAGVLPASLTTVFGLTW
jgi:hypothetical protein